jgi:outer membrane protein assembly factor BamB
MQAFVSSCYRTPWLLVLVMFFACSDAQRRIETPKMLTGHPQSGTPSVDIKWTHQLVPDDAMSLALGTELSQATFGPEGRQLFVGSRDTGLFAFNVASGDVLWNQHLDGGVVGSPAIGKTLAFVGAGSGELVAVEKETGQQVWQTTLKGMVVTRPILFGNDVIVRDGTNTIYAFDQATGAWRWQVSRAKPLKFSAAGESPLFIASGQLYVGLSNGLLLCLDAANKGKLLWELDLGGDGEGFKDVDANFTFYRQYLSVANVATGVALVDTRGRVKSRLARPLVVSQVSVDSNLILANGDGEIYRLDPERNRVLWKSRFSRNNGPAQRLILIDNLVFATFPRGGLVALNANDGQPVYGLDIGHGLTGLSVHPTSRTLALMSNRGTLMVLAPKAQQKAATSPFTPLIGR